MARTDRRLIGVLKTWHTRARREWRDAAGVVGATVWLCPKCGYWPSSDSLLPVTSCLNCGEQWKSRADDPAATSIVVRTTDYGYELVSIGQHSASDASVVTGERK